jgi:hypothetical protein
MQIKIEVIKKYAPLIVSAVVYVALMGALFHFQQRASLRVRGINDEHTKNQETLKTLVSSKPRPSKADAERYRVDREALEKTYLDLVSNVAALGGPAIKGEEILPTGFYAYMTNSLGSFTNRAAKAGVTIPENFNFGFGYYEGTFPGKNKTSDEAKALTVQLTRQLKICEAAADVLIGAKIEQLVALRRVDIEGVGAFGTLNGAIAKGPDGLYTMMPFELEFYCGAPELQDVLNSFASSNQYWVVRAVTAMTVDEKNVAVVTPAKVAMHETMGGTSVAAPRVASRHRGTGRFGPSEPVKPAPPKIVETVAVGGTATNAMVDVDTQTRKRLHVTLRVDYIEFSSPTNQAPSIASASTTTPSGN